MEEEAAAVAAEPEDAAALAPAAASDAETEDEGRFSPLQGDLQGDGDLEALKAELDRRGVYGEAMQLVLIGDYAFFRTWLSSFCTLSLSCMSSCFQSAFHAGGGASSSSTPFDVSVAAPPSEPPAVSPSALLPAAAGALPALFRFRDVELLSALSAASSSSEVHPITS